MPRSLPGSIPVLGCLGILVLAGCFGYEPDDSPYTIPRGEDFQAVQLEIEPDGTPLIMAQVGMYMAHNDPDPSLPDELQVAVQNYRSILLRRSEGEWIATGFKNIQNYRNAFPTLIPDSEGRFQAFLSDGGEIKRYVFGDGSWNRAAGTEWPEWILYGGGYSGGRNWNRHPHIAVAGTDLLLTLHTNWGGSFWVMEGKDRKVELLDSSGLDPLAFHTGAGFRAMAAMGRGNSAEVGRDGVYYTTELQYYRWSEGANRAEKRTLGLLEFGGETFFAPYHGRTALFTSGRSSLLSSDPYAVIAFTLDDSGRVVGKDSLTVPDLGQAVNPMLAVDTSGCLHGLASLPDSASPSIRYAHWNGCRPEAPDTLSVPKPDPAKVYWAIQANLRVAPDGTPVAALLVREVEEQEGPYFRQSWSDPTFLYLAEFRGGAWRVEKVDERRPRVR